MSKDKAFHKILDTKIVKGLIFKEILNYRLSVVSTHLSKDVVENV